MPPFMFVHVIYILDMLVLNIILLTLIIFVNYKKIWLIKRIWLTPRKPEYRVAFKNNMKSNLRENLAILKADPVKGLLLECSNHRLFIFCCPKKSASSVAVKKHYQY